MVAPDPFYVALAGALVGGCLSGLLSFLVQRWRYNIDRWTVVTDELCKEVVAIGDLSAEFWLSKRNANNKDEMAFKEMRIKGSIARIDALKAPLKTGAHTVR